MTLARILLAIIILAVVAVCFILYEKNVFAQSADIYVDVTIGEGADPDIIGFERNAYGSIDPNGFISDAYSGSINQITWNSDTKQLLVTLTTVPSMPLGQALIERGDPYACTPTGSRAYVCEYDEDADSNDAEVDTPWIVGREYSVRLRFSDTTSGSTSFPSPTRQPDLPPGYGTRAPDEDITLTGMSSGVKHIAFGSSYVYVREVNHVYVYDMLDDGARNTDQEFNVSSSSKGLAYAGGGLWVVEDANDGSSPYTASTLKGYYITDTGSGGATTDVEEYTMDGTSVDNWLAYAVTSVDGQLLVRYRHQGSGSTEYYWGRWYTYGSQNGDEVSTGASDTKGTLGFTADPTGNLVWIEAADVEDQVNGGFNDNGYGAYNHDALVNNGDYIRLNDYDVWTQDIDPTGVGFLDSKLYTTYIESSVRAAYAYQADSDLVYDRSTDFAQTPPTITNLEVVRTYQDDDAQLVDLSLVWTHTSRVGDGDTIMEYRFSSPVTGDIGPVRVSPFPTEDTISGLPRDSYNLELEMRYQWYNNQDPESASSQHILIRNPPGVDDSVCDEANTDEFTSGLSNDDSIDATEDADTQTPGCAFYLDPGRSRYSQWASVRTNIVGSTVGVGTPEGAPHVMTYMTGLPGIMADLMVVMGSNPAEVGPLARTFTVMLWLVVSVGAAFGVYVATGFRTGSTYLGTLVFLILWTGLGQFVAGIPPAMAYMPAALLLLPIAMLLLKRGKV